MHFQGHFISQSAPSPKSRPLLSTYSLEFGVFGPQFISPDSNSCLYFHKKKS